MPRIKLYVSDAEVHGEVTGILTSGMVGVPVDIICDESWSGLKKTLVCRAGDVIRTVLVDRDSAVVAREVMVAGKWLELGIEGRNNDGTVVIPTLWDKCGIILDGVDANEDPTTDPTLPVWAQLQNRVEDLENQEDPMPSISDIGALPAPASAEVGQYFRVSAVDETGKVTSVEAVEAPAGSCKGWNDPIVITIEGDTVSMVEQDVPEGTTEILIRVHHDTANISSGTWRLLLRDGVNIDAQVCLGSFMESRNTTLYAAKLAADYVIGAHVFGNSDGSVKSNHIINASISSVDSIKLYTAVADTYFAEGTVLNIFTR